MSFESLSVLREKYCCPMNFGVAIPTNNLTNSDCVKIIPYVFDSITCENDMKPNRIRTDLGATTTNYNTINSYNYTNSDKVINFAKEHNMKMLGHTLWYDPSNIPKFINDLNKNKTLTAPLMSKIIEDHIRNVIKHFHTVGPNTIYAWQVTNEVLSDDGKPQTNQLIQQILGDASFSNLYQYAKNAITTTTNEVGINQPNIKLFYNDYRDLATNGIFTRLQSLKNAGLLDGIGIQCHGTSIASLSAMTEKYIQAGFEVHYTEVDNAASSKLNDPTLTSWYREVIQIALKYGVRNFTVWGLTDDRSWLYLKHADGRTYVSLSEPSPRYPLLFDSSYQPKPCYNALIQELKTFGNQVYDIFIILGQSNSCGRGRTEYTFDNRVGGGTYDMRSKRFYDDDFNNKFNENIRQFSYDNRIVPAFERLDHLEGVGVRNTYGFGLSFARQYIKEGKLTAGRKILLIGCGWGGTGFLNTTVGSNTWNMTVANNLYERALKRIKIAQSAIGSASSVKAILWHQGEADADYIRRESKNTSPRTPPRSASEVTTLYNSYKTQLGNLLNTLRTNIGCPSLPILSGGLSPSGYRNEKVWTDNLQSFNMIDANFIKVDPTKGLHSYYEEMNGKIEEVTKNPLNTSFYFVPSVPIPSVPDFNHYLKGDRSTGIVHFNKSSEIELGKRYFYVFNNNHINNDRPFT